MTRPNQDDVLLEVASVIAQRSTCSRLNVGAVLAREGRILATGYNGAPTGMAHCDHSCDCPFGTDSSLLAECTSTCSTRNPCKISVHAESNAIAFAAKYGIALDGSVLYCTHAPCLPCAQLLINAGIARVYARRFYRSQDGLDLFAFAGIPWLVNA